MNMKTNGTNRMPAGRGNMLLALGILAVLVMAVAAFAVAEHPAVELDAEATDGKTGGGGTQLRQLIPTMWHR